MDVSENLGYVMAANVDLSSGHAHQVGVKSVDF